MFLTVRGILYPFIGTVLGSSFAVFMKHPPSRRFMAVLDSLAAGIMCAASFFSLILPAVNQGDAQGGFAKLSCSIGFFTGIIFFVFTDKLLKKYLSHKDMSANKLFLAVSLHNIPEGMAVGVVYAGLLTGNSVMGTAGALALSLGIAMQNIPEGAIISLPLKARGKKRKTAFLCGTVSGVAELAAAVITLFFSGFIYTLLPFSLCFAAGAMFYVVMRELSVNFSDRKNADVSLSFFAVGFVIMMLLDTYLG